MSHQSSTVSTTPVLPRRGGISGPVDRRLLEANLDEASRLTEILQRGPIDPDTDKHGGMNALQLVDRTKTTTTPDGWGDHSAGFDAPDKTRRVIDKNGDPIEPDPEPASPVSDPTGGAALAAMNARADKDRTAASQLERDVKLAVELLRDAVRALYDVQPAGRPAPGSFDAACTSHARLHRFEPADPKVPGSGLCRWCYDWRRIHGKVPALPILEARVAGRYITKAMMKKHKLSA